MSLVYVDEDPWIREHEACEALCAELASRLASGTSAAAADVSLRMRQCDQQLAQLRGSLHSNVSERVSVEGRRRRESQLVTLEARARRLRSSAGIASDMSRGIPTTHNGNASASTQASRAKLFAYEDDEALLTVNEPMDTETRIQRQKQLLQEQDQGLDVLAQIISRQRNIAENIGNEVTSQNQLVSDIADNVDRVGAGTEEATRRTAGLIRKDNTWGYWGVIIALLVAIIVVAIL